MANVHINPDPLFKFDQLSQVVVTGPKLAFISGQTAMTGAFEVIGGDDYYEQSLQALRHLKIAVEAAGGNLADLVSTTVYVKNLNAEAGEKYMAALATGVDGQPLPAHAFTMVGVAALGSPELLVEISGIAAIN